MTLGADRYGSRADTLVFLGCIALAVAAMSLPDTWRDPIAKVLRQTVLAPFLTLQEQTETLRTSQAHLTELTAQRDSAQLAATFLPELRSENARLRQLLGLGSKLNVSYVPAEVLHQAGPTDPLTLVVSAGRKQGVRPLDTVVGADGFVGLVGTVDERTSVVMTWAYPEFRASAMAEDGSVFGIVAPRGTEGPGVWLLELQGVAYRQVVPIGTVIVTAGLGGVIARGIPLGVVTGVAAEEEHWERTYLVRPSVHPAAVTHVMILTGAPHAGGDVHAAFQAEGKGP
ncbi:MAG TPA: rod shape-determining protein MreC [Gemmatimonadales bacterium]|nr:rod shape-determining protein MreC [Gemmatimonadales bacterium]